jgi:hypothetical protein
MVCYIGVRACEWGRLKVVANTCFWFFLVFLFCLLVVLERGNRREDPEIGAEGKSNDLYTA